MIAVLATDKRLAEMLTLEAKRCGFQTVSPGDARVILLEITQKLPTLPKGVLTVGFSKEAESDPVTDILLPLPYPTEKLHAILFGVAGNGYFREGRTIFCGGARVRVSPTEETILEALEAAAGKTVKTEDLVSLLPGGTDHSNTLQVLLSRLRKKLSADGISRIHCVRGQGYALLAERNRYAGSDPDDFIGKDK